MVFFCSLKSKWKFFRKSGKFPPSDKEKKSVFMVLDLGKFLSIFVKWWSKRESLERKGQWRALPFAFESLFLVLVEKESLEEEAVSAQKLVTAKWLAWEAGGRKREDRRDLSQMCFWSECRPHHCLRLWAHHSASGPQLLCLWNPPTLFPLVSSDFLTLTSPHPQRPWTQPTKTWLSCHSLEVDFQSHQQPPSHLAHWTPSSP